MSKNTKANETVSIYKISEELFEEEGRSKGMGDFNDYYKRTLEKFREIFLALGVDNKTLKDVEGKTYKVDAKHKEKVKDLIRSYTSKPMKKVRKHKYEEIEIGKLEEITSQVDEILKTALTKEEYLREKAQMNVVTRQHFLKEMKAVKAEGVSQIIKDMEEIKPLISGKTLNEMDKVYLLRYYKDLIKAVSKQWRGVVEILIDNRSEEIVEITSDMMENELDEKEMEKELLERMTDSPTALWEAIQIYTEEIKIDRKTKLKRYTKKEYEEVGKLIEELKRERS